MERRDYWAGQILSAIIRSEGLHHDNLTGETRRKQLASAVWQMVEAMEEAKPRTEPSDSVSEA